MQGYIYIIRNLTFFKDITEKSHSEEWLSALDGGLEYHAFSFIGVLIKLVKVEIAVGIHGGFIHLIHKGQILLRRRQFTDQRRHGCQLRRGQEDVRAGT